MDDKRAGAEASLEADESALDLDATPSEAGGPKRNNARAPEKKPTRRERTAAQLVRQEKAYDLSTIGGLTIRQIARQLNVNPKTVLSDIRSERDRRVSAMGELESTSARADAIAVYRRVIREALKAINGGSDRALDSITKAQERIDKILGVDAPMKLDAGLDALVEAFAPKE